MNKYLCFWKKQTLEVEALTTLQAQDLAAAKFKARKAYEVTVMLVEREGVEVIHSTSGL